MPEPLSKEGIAALLSTERELLIDALNQIAVCCDNGSTNEGKLTFIRKVARNALRDVQ